MASACSSIPKMDPVVDSFYTKLPGYAESYNTSHRPRCKWVMERFGLNKLESQRIVGLGEGMGNNFEHFKPSNHLVSLDGAIIPPSSKLCPFLSLRMNLDETDFGSLFDNEGPFDVMIACEFLEHVSHLNHVMRESKKLVKVNGTAVFTIPHVSVTHPTSTPGLFFPESNFREYLEQWAWIVEDFDIYREGWWTCAFKVRNAPIQEARPKFPKNETKFINSDPVAWPNL